MLQRIFIFNLIILSFFACKPVKIKNASKQKIVSGVLKGTSGTNFSVTLKVNNSIIVDAVCIGNKTNLFRDYDIYNLSNGVILKPRQVLGKGEYYIQIFSSKSDFHFNDFDTVFINYLIHGKLKTIDAKFENRSDLLMKNAPNN